VGRALTKSVAMVLFSQARSLIPFISGRVSMQYINMRRPGVSMVSQPILPGRLSRDVTDVLPIPYQFKIHWKRVNCSALGLRLAKHFLDDYEREKLKYIAYELPVLPGGR